jgi:site-specific DNA-methyltransferase (adenine-specific)
MHNNPLPRLDENPEMRSRILPHCRLKPGEVWEDPVAGHRVACIDAGDSGAVAHLMREDLATLAVHDPPYNLVAFETRELTQYVDWCRTWVSNSLAHMTADSSLYIWLGADQRNHYQPLPDFMLMMRDLPIRSRSLITVRNQRGYGTQKNWMAIRQELLYYSRGNPTFNVAAEYTDIPKTLKGYYKDVGGAKTENTERGKGDTIRAGNVWVDIQQIFYRLQENVSGCYAQKPLKSVARILEASSLPGECVLDLFSHSGTTLLASEIAGRRCFTSELDPVFCEMTILRLEHYRATGKTGWQNGHAFESLATLEPHLAADQDPTPLAQSTLFG